MYYMRQDYWPAFSTQWYLVVNCCCPSSGASFVSCFLNMTYFMKWSITIGSEIGNQHYWITQYSTVGFKIRAYPEISFSTNKQSSTRIIIININIRILTLSSFISHYPLICASKYFPIFSSLHFQKEPRKSHSFNTRITVTERKINDHHLHNALFNIRPPLIYATR